MTERRDLSLTERAVAKLVAEGCEAMEVAERLGLSLYAVQHRIRDAAGKLEGRGAPTVKLTRWWCLVGLPEAQAQREALERAA